MAITRRTSAAYSSFIAATSLHNNTLQDGQNSRGSLGWYENDENIINRSNQNPFCDYSRNGRRSTEISELPKIFVEDDHQDLSNFRKSNGAFFKKRKVKNFFQVNYVSKNSNL